jgi:nicotinate-nucleotide adenylyltransferase
LRVGILGGAFNPPHLGHLVCAQEAVVKLELERVTFMPFGDPPHRSLEHDPGPDARVEMCERAIAGDEHFEVSRLEVDRDGPSYTVETLRELGASGDELFLILGGDQAANLPRWHEPEEVLSLATVAAVERTGFSRNTIAVKTASLRGAQAIRFFDMPRMGISSSLIRRRASSGLPIRYLVPEPVADYIAEHGLYGAHAQAAAR